MQNDDDDGELHRQHLQSLADEEEVPEQDQARLRFDDLTRKKIALAYSKKAPKKSVHNDFDVELFLRILEGVAFFYRRLQTIEVRTQKERLRSIDAAAAALEKSVERIKEMDSGALGC